MREGGSVYERRAESGEWLRRVCCWDEARQQDGNFKTQSSLQHAG